MARQEARRGIRAEPVGGGAMRFRRGAHRGSGLMLFLFRQDAIGLPGGGVCPFLWNFTRGLQDRIADARRHVEIVPLQLVQQRANG